MDRSISYVEILDQGCRSARIYVDPFFLSNKKGLKRNGTNLRAFEIQEDGILLSIDLSRSYVKRDNKSPASFVMP
jgi:hypothetical protein